MQKKIIFLDIDGTLIDFHGRLPESAKRALELAKAAGHHLVLCTGRTRSEIYPELLKMNFDGIIGSAGAYVECGGEVIYRHVIDEEHLASVLDFFGKKGITYCLQTGEGVVMTGKNRIGFRDHFLKAGIKEEDIWRILVASVIEEEDSRMRKNVEKVAYYGAPFTIEEIQQVLGAYFKVEGASYGKNTVSNGEITCANETKATGIQRYMRHIGARMEQTIGIGDGLNDVDMFSQTAFTVAMGNAKPETKAIADYITTDVNEDGLWNGFKYLGLI